MLLSLTDDVVACVASFLDVRDQRRLAASCKALRAASAAWLPAEVPSLQLASSGKVTAFADFCWRHRASWRLEALTMTFVPGVPFRIDFPAAFPGGSRWPISRCLGALPIGLTRLDVTSAFDPRLSGLSRLTSLESLALRFATDHLYREMDLRPIARLPLTHLELGRAAGREVTAWLVTEYPFPRTLRSLVLDFDVVMFMELLDGLRGLRDLRDLTLRPIEAVFEDDDFDGFVEAFTDTLCDLQITRLSSATYYTRTPESIRDLDSTAGFREHVPAPHVTSLEVLCYEDAMRFDAYPSLRRLRVHTTNDYGSTVVRSIGPFPPALTYLSLNGCSLDRVPGGVSAVTSLLHLDLSDNPRMFADDPRAGIDDLGKLTNLQTLDARDTGIEDPETVLYLYDVMPLLCIIRLE